MPRPLKGMFLRGKSWYVRVRQDERDRWVSLGPNFTAACERCRQIRKHGPTGKPDRPKTVDDVWPDWIASYVATARTERCSRDAEARARRYLSQTLGRVCLDRLTETDLRAYRTALERSGLAPQTVAHILSDLRCLLAWCVRVGHLDRSPWVRGLMPKIPERAPDRLTDQEVERLVAMPEPYGWVCRLGLATGLRWSELRIIEAKDVHDGVLTVVQPKTGKLISVPLPDGVASEIRMRVGKLVPFEHAGNFTRRARQLSGVEDFRAHRMRHTFATRWVEAGGSPAVLQRILGHSSLRTTERYARVSDEAVIREARRVHAVATM